MHNDFLASLIARIRRRLLTLSLKIAIVRMTLKDVHGLSTEKAAVSFLSSVGFYTGASVDCTTCTSTLKEVIKKDHEEEYLLGCRKRGCGKTVRLRHIDPFSRESNCRVSLTSILELTTLLVHITMDTREIADST